MEKSRNLVSAEKLGPFCLVRNNGHITTYNSHLGYTTRNFLAVHFTTVIETVIEFQASDLAKSNNNTGMFINVVCVSVSLYKKVFMGGFSKFNLTGC